MRAFLWWFKKYLTERFSHRFKPSEQWSFQEFLAALHSRRNVASVHTAERVDGEITASVALSKPVTPRFERWCDDVGATVTTAGRSSHATVVFRVRGDSDG